MDQSYYQYPIGSYVARHDNEHKEKKKMKNKKKNKKNKKDCHARVSSPFLLPSPFEFMTTPKTCVCCNTEPCTHACMTCKKMLVCILCHLEGHRAPMCMECWMYEPGVYFAF